MKVFIASMVSVVLIILGAPAPSQAAPRPKVNLPVGLTITAHKTGPTTGPENTVAGLINAKDADPLLAWEEIDIRWNKSNFPVAMHDATVDRTTNKTGALNTWYLSDTNVMNSADYNPWKTDPRYDPNSNGSFPENVPYGWDIFNAANTEGVNLLLDVKEVPNQVQAEKLYHYISSFSYVDNVIYMSSVAGVTAMKGFYPDLTFAVIEYPPTGRMYEADYLKSLGVSAYAVNITRIKNKSFVDYYHANNLEVLTWTSDNEAQDVAANWTKAKSVGVDMLITNLHVSARSALSQE